MSGSQAAAARARSGETARPATPGSPRGLPLGIVLQAVNAAGDGLAMVALANRVFQSSHASWAVAAVFLAITVPISALAPVAGLLLDRLPVRAVLVAAAATEAAIAIALAFAPGLTATLLLSAGFGVCAAILQPGLAAIVPRLVTDRMVIKANSYLQAATWVGFTIGPLLAGLLISVSGSALALLVNGALYAATAAGIAALRLASAGSSGAADTPGKPGLGVALRAGLNYLRADADAGLLVLVVGIMTAFANMAVVAEVVFAEHVLHAGPTGYSLLVAGWTSGMVAGTLAGGRLGRRWLVTGALAGTVLTGAGVALAGTAVVLWQAVAAYAAGGLASGFEVVATRSYLGHRVPSAVAGRVFAVYSGVLFGGISIGMAVAAWLLSVLGARWLLITAGLCGVLAGLAGSAVYLARHKSGASTAPPSRT